MQTRISELREELEARHKHGTVKMAHVDGTPVSTETIQNELYKLTYKLSKLD
jgi:hypothetical protein